MLTSLTAVAAMAKGWPSTWAVTTTTERTRLRSALFSVGARSSSMAVVLPCEACPVAEHGFPDTATREKYVKLLY
ncbi:hypothetical protein D3C80_2035150 [compost metagenome]